MQRFAKVPVALVTSHLVAARGCSCEPAPVREAKPISQEGEHSISTKVAISGRERGQPGYELVILPLHRTVLHLSRGCGSHALALPVWSAAVGAVGTNIPLNLQQPLAARAGSFETRAAGGAYLKIALDAVVARRESLAVGHLRQQ